MRFVNLGCGSRFCDNSVDWLNIDITAVSPSVKACNLRDGIPLPDNSVEVVYHSHLLEHLSRNEAASLVSECRRVLVPGGILRVAVPDLEEIVRAYLENLDDARAGKDGAEARHEWMSIELLDQMVREKSGGEMLAYLSQKSIPAEEFILKRLGKEAVKIIERSRSAKKPDSKNELDERRSNGLSILKQLLKRVSLWNRHDPQTLVFRKGGEVHRWMYDSLSLRRLLAAAGFVEIIQRTAKESYIQGWEKNNLDTEADGSIYKPDSFYMEARKAEGDAVFAASGR